MNAYDRSLARRAFAIGGVAAAVTLLVVAATDEGGPWAQRAGMTAAIAPIAGGLGALGAVRIAAARGELRALAAIGVERLHAVIGAVIGGAAVGLAGALVAASGRVDLAALFPRAPAARVWRVEGAGLAELTLGLRVGPGGAITLVEPSAQASGPPAGAAAFAAAALAIAAIACPLWIAVEARAWRRAVVAIAAAGAAIAAFQGVAAGRAPPHLLAVGPLLLVTDAALARYRARPRW